MPDEDTLMGTCYECGVRVEAWRGGMVWRRFYCGKHFSAEFASFMFVNLERVRPWPAL